MKITQTPKLIFDNDVLKETDESEYESLKLSSYLKQVFWGCNSFGCRIFKLHCYLESSKNNRGSKSLERLE